MIDAPIPTAVIVGFLVLNPKTAVTPPTTIDASPILVTGPFTVS